MLQEYIEVGQIVNTHGIKGEIKINPLGFDPEFIAGFKTLYIDGVAVRPTSRRIHKNTVMIMIPGVNDIDTALTYKNKIVSIRRKDAHLPKGEYFDEELKGMQVYDYFPRRLIGTLDEVLSYPAHKIYVVHGEGKEYLIPAVPDVFIQEIHMDENKMIVRMMKGLETDAH
ncbi:MAG: 16S rRNA processing protein RimM [Oscillospiraceae bacterium]|nr:16S rRNA processing protein RimM [Oscillospiraceae bacterium]